MVECIRCKKEGEWFDLPELCDSCLDIITDCKHCNIEFCNNNYINCILIKEFKREKASTLEKWL